jgi:hypothetical protein
MTQGVEMGTLQLRVIGEGLFFLIILLSGIWLRNAGKPYNNIILTPHKLLSVATAILLFWTIRQMNQATHLGTTALFASVITGLLFLGCIVSGALVTTDLSLPAIVSKMHKVIPYLTVLSTAATLYFLVYQK